MRVGFGNYGGLPVKIAYTLLSLALTAVCATETFIWLGKRRRRRFDEAKLRAAWNAVVWGALAALTVTLAVRLTPGHWAPFAAMLWLGLAATVAAAVAAAGRSRQSAAAVAQQA